MKNWFIFLLILGIQNSFAQSKEEKEADKAFAIKDFEKASNLYKLAYQKDPKNININTNICISYLEISKEKSALKHINVVFEETKQPTTDLFYLKAKCLQLNHQFDSAAFYYQKSDPFNANKRDISKKLIECNAGIELMKFPKNYRIRNINQINSKYHDIAPKTTADFEEIYFTSLRTNTAHPENVYVSHNRGGAWSSPINIGEPINSEEINDACLGLSPDGQTMYVYKGINGGDIYESQLRGKRWSEPKAMPFNTPQRETSICISPDGNALYFVREPLNEKGEPMGNSDIFVCKKNSFGDWSKSVKMGPTINTGYDEESPCVHADGKTLYFSSKGHNSMGGFDIFKSEWDGQNWGKPENMGFPLNSASDERSYVLAANGTFALYASQKESEGLGGLDIYFITMPPNKTPDLTLLKGKITDALTGEAIEAKITITDNELNTVVAEFRSNSETGEYLISLPSGKNYSLTVEKSLHVFYSENIYLAANSGFVEQKSNVQLMNLSKGSRVILKNIFFATNSFEISQNSNAELEKLRNFLVDNPSINIQIAGHTDHVGDEKLNTALSQNRANSVRNYLVNKGIDAKRLQAKGFGSSKPIADNTSEENKAKNRRTEFTIL